MFYAAVVAYAFSIKPSRKKEEKIILKTNKQRRPVIMYEYPIEIIAFNLPRCDLLNKHANANQLGLLCSSAINMREQYNAT